MRGYILPKKTMSSSVIAPTVRTAVTIVQLVGQSSTIEFW